MEGQDRREVEPESPRTAAWGDPPIVLRCGVEQPEAYDPSGTAVEVNGVAWFLEQQPEGYRFTTTDHVVRIEVVVPRAYAPEVNPLVDLASAVDAAVPREE